jgi:aminoglycoside phosphotransferase (APT) family kinase protein
MAEPSFDQAALLAQINALHGTALRAGGPRMHGENQGAYPVVNGDGERVILKLGRAEAGLFDRLARAEAITARLHALGAPVPQYVMRGTTPDGTRYYLQEALAGEPVGRLLRPEHLDRLFALNDLQAGQAVSAEQDWSRYVADLVLRGESGWADELRAYGSATARLVDALATLTAGRERFLGTHDDIVHGDFSPGNILVHDGQISGVVDWDAAGCGDRAFDLALLLFYFYDDRPIRDPLRDRVLALAGFDALCVYLAYAILSQTASSSRHHGQSAVEHWLSRAGRILHDLQALI